LRLLDPDPLRSYLVTTICGHGPVSRNGKEESENPATRRDREKP
jgi:hypothetical protein